MNRVCPLCSSQNFSALGVKGDQTYYRCANCALVIGSSFWEPTRHEEVTDLYGERYFANFGQMHPKTTARYHEFLDVIEPRIKEGKLVEIGFGNGQFLRAAKERNWDVTGVEISQVACDAVPPDLGIKVLCGNYEEVPIEPNSVDVVVSMETIEHLFDPLSLVNWCHKVLRVGGIVFLTTPNANCLTRKLIGMDWRAYGRGHPILFTFDRLKKTLMDGGFEVFHGETRTIFPSTITNVWKSRLFGKPRTAAKAGLPSSPGNISLSDAQELRERVDGNPFLRGAKGTINVLLNLTKTGEKSLVFCRKR